MFGLPKGPQGQTLLFSSPQPQAPQVRIDAFIDPKEDEGTAKLLEDYVLENPDKPPLEYPLLVRVDQYKKESSEANPVIKKQYEDSYPRKYVSMFILNTPKGKIVSPTLNALMDKFDQQQLKMKDENNLQITGAVYANDKVREFEFLKQIKKDNRTPDQKQRFKLLRQTIREISPPPEEEAEGNEESTPETPNGNLKDLAFLKEEAAKLQKTLANKGKRAKEDLERRAEQTRRLTSELPDGWTEFTNPSNKQTTYFHPNGRETIYPPTANTPTTALLPGWKEALDPRSKQIYYTHPDGAVVWDFPTADTPTGPALPAGWAEATSTDGKTYYYHTNGRTVWERPTAGGKHGRRTRHHRARNNKTRRNKRNKRKSKSNKNKRNKTKKH